MYLTDDGLKILFWVVVGGFIVWHLARIILEYTISSLFDYIGNLFFGPGTKISRMEKLCTSLGMELRSSGVFSHEWAGQWGPHQARLTFLEGKSFTVMIEGPVPASLRVTTGEFRAEAELQTGDPDFDREVAIGGDKVIGLAIFDEKTRAHVRELIAKGYEIEVEDGWVRLRETKPGLSSSQLIDCAKPVLDLAEELAGILGIQGNELPNRLAHNAEHDPVAEVRRNNAKALRYHFPSHPERLRLLEADPLSAPKNAPGA